MKNKTKIVNRGFISVKAKKAFWDWAVQFDEELNYNENDDCESSIYLIEDDFIDAEPILEKTFKKIFYNELIAIADEEDFPEKLTIELFLEWFDVDFGVSVFDLEKNDLKAENED